LVLVFFSYFYQKYIIKIYFDHELWDTLYIHKSVHVTKHVLTSLPLVDFVLEAPDRLRQIYIECVYEKKVNNQHRPNTEKKKKNNYTKHDINLHQICHLVNLLHAIK